MVSMHKTGAERRKEAPARRDDQTKFYSVAEAAALFGMSSMTLYRAISAGEFPAVRIRGRLIVPARAVEAMADAALAAQTEVDASAWVPEQEMPR